MRQEYPGWNYRTTYIATQSPLEILNFLLLTMRGDTLMRPPRPARRLENNDESSQTMEMASFRLVVSCLVVGRTASGLMILSLMKGHSSGGVGMHRMRTLGGIDMKPSASEVSGVLSNHWGQRGSYLAGKLRVF